MQATVNKPKESLAIEDAIARSQRDAVWTTGRIAKLVKVASRTVSKWFDSGRLKGYRVPGSKDRRVRTSDLHAFLLEHGLVEEARRVCPKQILFVGLSTSQVASFKQSSLDTIDGEAAPDAFAAALAAGEQFWPVVICEFSAQPKEIADVARRLRKIAATKRSMLVAIVGEDQRPADVLPDDVKFEIVLTRPFDAAALADRIRDLFVGGNAA